ncbi:MAG: MaoC family dehydratase N-terminal domain-containing protein [Chloroflexi bacterium]|nr:MaoC family dehydratase N-terminal domain-containing protein [Chloroflexota bacterium]
MTSALITEEMRTCLGQETAPVLYEIEKGAVRKFARAIDNPNPAYIDEAAGKASRYGGIVAPPTFLRSLIPGREPRPFPEPFKQVLDAGSAYRFHEPLRAGDMVTVVSKLVDLFEKSGRFGPMMFKVREISYTNQHGRLAATQRTTLITYPTPPSPPAPSPGSYPTPPSAAGGLSQAADPWPAGASDPSSGGNSGNAPRSRSSQLRFEDLNPGDAIPVLRKRPTTRQLVMYAGASDDYVAVHYDRDVAALAGHPRVIVHGALKSAFLAQMLTDWIGADGQLAELEVQYRAVDYPGDVLTCGGRVTRKRPEGKGGLADCEIWLQNGAGQVTTPGKATVWLPL